MPGTPRRMLAEASSQKEGPTCHLQLEGRQAIVSQADQERNTWPLRIGLCLGGFMLVVLSAFAVLTLSSRGHFLSDPVAHANDKLAVAFNPGLVSAFPARKQFYYKSNKVPSTKYTVRPVVRPQMGFRPSVLKLQAAGVDIESASGPTENLKTLGSPAVDIVELPTNENSEKLFKIRHSSALVMAMAVKRLFPETATTSVTIVENGFYSDFDPGEKGPFTDEDLKKIKKEMDRIGRERLEFRQEKVSRVEAHSLIEATGAPYKLEILDSIQEEPITLCHIGEEFWDLCAPRPLVEHTAQIPPKANQLETVAGAYWQGDESRPMLQRIYGTAWESKDQLQEHKRRVEEAKKRDHRGIGKQLDLFSIQEDAGGGLVFWHPKGSIVRRKIEDFWKDVHVHYGYDLLYTPHIANLDLWKTSGHYDFYRDGMFDQMDVEDEQYQIKPMNCPFHVLTYKTQPRSYRDLPIRYAELGNVYRYERSGTLHGLMRVRGFTQDDGHIFCLPDQVTDEIVETLDLTEDILTRFGFTDYEIMLSTRPKKSVGTDEIWELATNSLKAALERKGWKYTIDEGDGAFYGPKIDLKIKDAIGRTWQCSTIQADFNLPERFDMEYVDADNQKKRPIMIHRAIFGSIERFFGVLLESTAGNLPLWLAPEQMRLALVTDDARGYAEDLVKEGRKRGLRVSLPRGNEKLGKLIRNSEIDRVPIVGVIGNREAEERTIKLRVKGVGDIGSMPRDEVMNAIALADERAVNILDVLELPEPDKASEPATTTKTEQSAVAV